MRYTQFHNFHNLSPRIQWESKIIWFYCISWCWPMISSSLPFLWDYIWKKVRWRSSFYTHAFIDQSSHQIVAEAIIVRGLVWFTKRWAFKICLRALWYYHNHQCFYCGDGIFLIMISLAFTNNEIMQRRVSAKIPSPFWWCLRMMFWCVGARS